MAIKRAYTRVVGVALIATFCTACTRTARVQPSEGGYPVHATRYFVHTTDGRTYSATEYIYDDSTLVITRFWHQVDDAGNAHPAPFAIRRDRVASVERVSLNKDRTFFLMAGPPCS